ncbi:MAG: hypothetical protein AAFQ90_01580 [Pseudomonadota bacterium]
MLGLGLRGAGALSSFALAWILAQQFGARTVGLYQLGFTTATLLTALAVLSQDVVLVREVAPLLKNEKQGEAARRFRGARRLVLIAGSALAVLAALLAYPLAVYGLGEEAAAPFILALAPAIVLLPQMRVHNALLRCLGKVTLSQTLEGVSYTTFAMVGLLILWVFSDWLVPLAAPALVVLGLVISVFVGYSATAKYLKSWPQEGEPIAPDKASGAWIAAGPITAQASNWLILLVITAMLSASDGGIFRIAVLICTLMQLISTSFATMAGPYLSRASQADDLALVRRTIAVSGAIGAAIASPVALLAIFAPVWVMSLFGEEFVSGADALTWLALAQLVNVAAGPVGAALVMQKRERVVLAVEVCASALGLGIAVILLPMWGLAGAGLGVLAAAIVRNGANGFFVLFSRPITSATQT